jgi:hypothetical protein
LRRFEAQLFSVVKASIQDALYDIETILSANKNAVRSQELLDGKKQVQIVGHLSLSKDSR